MSKAKVLKSIYETWNMYLKSPIKNFSARRGAILILLMLDEEQSKARRGAIYARRGVVKCIAFSLVSCYLKP